MPTFVESDPNSIQEIIELGKLDETTYRNTLKYKPHHHLTLSRKIELAQIIANGGRKRPASDPMPTSKASKAYRLDQEQSGQQEGQRNQVENQGNVNADCNNWPMVSQANVGERKSPASDPLPSTSRLDKKQGHPNPDPNSNTFETFSPEKEISPMTTLQMMILNEQQIAINYQKSHAAGVNKRTTIIENLLKSIQKKN
jgi:hypothetical protein